MCVVCDEVFRDTTCEKPKIGVIECLVGVACVEEVIGCIDRVKEAVSVWCDIKC